MHPRSPESRQRVSESARRPVVARRRTPARLVFFTPRVNARRARPALGSWVDEIACRDEERATLPRRRGLGLRAKHPLRRHVRGRRRHALGAGQRSLVLVAW